MEPLRDGKLELDDGRWLRWARWGAPDGTPLLFLHGSPSSRLEHLDEGVVRDLGIEQTTVDRPGVGGSSPQTGRRVIEWPADVERLADALGLARFIVVGHSMGGAYALACAVVMPERVTAVGLISSIAPWNEDAFAELVPPYVQPFRDAYARDPDAAVEEYRGSITELRRAMLYDPDAALDAFAIRTLSETDLALLRDHPTLREMMKASAAEHALAGTEGMFEERMAGHVMDWGFELAEVPLHVHVFQGADDAMLPPTVGRTLVDQLPSATYHEFPGVGHFLPLAREREVVEVVVQEARREDHRRHEDRPEGHPER